METGLLVYSVLRFCFQDYSERAGSEPIYERFGKDPPGYRTLGDSESFVVRWPTPYLHRRCLENRRRSATRRKEQFIAAVSVMLEAQLAAAGTGEISEPLNCAPWATFTGSSTQHCAQ